MTAEQFIQDCTRNCSNEMVFEDGSGAHVYEAWLTPDQARRAVEIAIEDACEFIETYPHLFMGVLRSEAVADFKNYMKGK